MTDKRPPELFIERQGQFRAVGSQRRLRILSLIQALEPCAVAEIADELDCPAEPLYYHVEILRKAGLIRVAGTRGVGRSKEKLYERTAARFRFHPTRRSPAFIRSLRRAYSAAFKIVERQLAAATGHPREVREGAEKNVRMQLYTERLDEAGLRELNTRLDAVRSLLRHGSSDKSNGTTYQVLLVTAPIVSDSKR